MRAERREPAERGARPHVAGSARPAVARAKREQPEHRHLDPVRAKLVQERRRGPVTPAGEHDLRTRMHQVVAHPSARVLERVRHGDARVRQHRTNLLAYGLRAVARANVHEDGDGHLLEG
jgi:hypothetical protein